MIRRTLNLYISAKKKEHGVPQPEMKDQTILMNISKTISKKAVATNQENKAVAEGDLEVVTKALNANKGDLSGLHHD